LRKDAPTELETATERCLQKVPAGRYQGVEELLLNLKPLAHQGVNQTANKRTVSLRSEADALNVQPYPGLAFFTEREVEYFHGRESRVESVWQKLRRGRLLAVTGPSGVGKTSFLRAGLIPTKPADWGVIITTPGGSPLLSLREAMVPALTDDIGAIHALLRVQDLDATVAGIRRWRDRHDEALLIFDQFEELFTLNPRQEQERFADLLSRLTFEADVHVLVSLRDDFLFHCQEFAGLAPLYESLTVLGPLTGTSLRRALVQPALDCGYAFEDETIVDEMMAEVEGERGALPLLAFAMARLWEGRDREQGVLTRRAYEKMGAVSGALAQHAESVMDQIGADKHPIVQELFRNLITAQGTRAVQDREKILSVFDAVDRPAAEEIQGKLIDARLLTSYEVKSEDGTEHHRVEIVHESLLNAWPRLVRWRTQDEDSAQLRDQLRQAAQLWEQKDCSDDLLWTGTSFLEFELWRGRYPGGLSAEEEGFAAAMKSRNLRAKRRKRLAISGAFLALLAVLVVVGAFGRRAEKMAKVSEARRFHMLAGEQLESDNTLALALATASLEREDNPVVRKLALAALWKGPCRQVLTLPDSMGRPDFAVRMSPDGKWLAVGSDSEVQLFPADGSAARTLPQPDKAVPYRPVGVDFDPGNQYLYIDMIPIDDSDWDSPFLMTLWSLPGEQIHHVWKWNQMPHRVNPFVRGNPPQLLVAQRPDDNLPWNWLRYSLDSGEPRDLGRADTTVENLREFIVGPTGRYLLDWKGPNVFLFPLDSLETARPILVGTHEIDIKSVAMDHEGRQVASIDKSGEIRVWEVGNSDKPIFRHRHRGQTQIRFPVFDYSGSRLAIKPMGPHQHCIYDLDKQGTEPLRLWPPRFGASWVDFTADGSWFVASGPEPNQTWFYPLEGPYPDVWRFYPDSLKTERALLGEGLTPKIILPDGRHMLADRGYGEYWICDLFSEQPACRLLFEHPTKRYLYSPSSNPTDRFILTGDIANGRAWLIPLNGNEPLVLGGFTGVVHATALSDDARRAAVGGFSMDLDPPSSRIRIWDLETGHIQELEPGYPSRPLGLWFLGENRLLASSKAGLRIWDLESGEFEQLSNREHLDMGDLDPQKRFFVIDTPEGATLWDLQEKTERILPIPSTGLWALAIAPNARFVVGGRDNGDVIFCSLDNDEVHLLLGHDLDVLAVQVLPGNREFISASADGTVRVWDLPVGPPRLSRPLKEFLATLRAQTNMRIVTDVETEDGYRIEYDRFPGWEATPTW